MGKLLNKNDIIGKRFDVYTVLRCVEGSNPLKYVVLCECGEQREILRGSLYKSRSKVCRCADNSENISGVRFGRLVAKELVRSEGDKRFWRCDCDCGNSHIASKSTLKGGNTASCGCLFKDKVIESLTTHGHSPRGNSSRTYRVYNGMKSRCLSPSSVRNKVYKDIYVCDRWKESFENFLEDMGECPSELHEIDRRDPELGYEPSNCRWATRQENSFNKRGKSNTTSKYKGVCFDKTGKRIKRWKAQVHIGGKKVFEGRFLTEEEAAIEYNKHALIYYGEFAYINKIDGEEEKELEELVEEFI